jgi:hypothetical protein
MTVPGMDAAQARYDAAEPPDEVDEDGFEAARVAHEDAQIERADARRKGDRDA